MPPLFIFVAAVVVAIFVAIVAIVAVTAVGLFCAFYFDKHCDKRLWVCVCGCKREGGMSRARESGDRLTFHMGSDRLWDYVITGSRKLDAEA